MTRTSKILINHISYALPNGKMLFNELTLSFLTKKIGLVGKNGIGKSTLLQLILGELSPSSGIIQSAEKKVYVPQHPQFSAEMTLAGFLNCEEKINALQRIREGSVDERDYLILNEDWNIDDRIQEQLAEFGLNHIPYDRPLGLLSGGELTRLLLAKTFHADADFILLDEPTNHLDAAGRQQLYSVIQHWQGGLIVVSHDRTLLNLMEEIVELNTLGASIYGGNYDFYANQKKIEKNAREQALHDANKLMHKTKKTVQASKEKHEKKQSYGKQLRKSGSIDKLGANSKKGRSERTQSKLLIKEERLFNQAEKKLQQAQEKIEITDEIHIDLPETKVPNSKMIIDIENICFTYPNTTHPIIENFDLKLQGPERIALSGKNGSGKTTLVKLILGELKPKKGKIYLGTNYISYLDQETSLLDKESTVLENFMRLNPDAKENDAYRSLASFLFKNVSALKLVKDLSGGEKLRALLACVLMSTHPPQLLILDEPTNHLDIQSVESIESALKNYQGAMIVISHDQKFLEEIGIKRIVHAPYKK